MKTRELKLEYLVNPIGIDVTKPRFFWQIESNLNNANQTAYRLQTSTDDFVTITWDTGKIESSECIQIPYEGECLKPKTRVFWRVKAWDNMGNESKWNTAYFETGLMDTAWDAKWITPAKGGKTPETPCPIVRKEFNVKSNIKTARLYITSLGLYQAELNGIRVGDMELTPGWTSYNNWVLYQTYDITENLINGDNAIAVSMGNGWYKGPLMGVKEGNIYGDSLGLIARLEVTYDDGLCEAITTDESWKSGFGPIRSSEIYHGEIYDARLEDNFSSVGFDEKEFETVKLLDAADRLITGQKTVAMRNIQEVKPVEMITTPNGDTVVDFGQNMVGWVRLTVNGKAGDEVFIRHGEVLLQDEFSNENYRDARPNMTYILKGDGEEIFEPHFTFYGFRYIKIEKFPGTPTLDNFTGVVVTSDMAYGGKFETSHKMLNKLFENIEWGQKGNFVDLPTDCPQRDERLGWTGDTQVFAATASFNALTATFYEKWLTDLKFDQYENGAVPHVIPDVLNWNMTSSAWGDAATIVPLAMYDFYADTTILEKQYDSMVKWVEYIKGEGDNEYIWDTGFHFGDWLAKDGYGKKVTFGGTPTDIIATSMFYKSTMNLAKAAQVLGKTKDAEKYNKLAEGIKLAFVDEFITKSGRLAGESQTAYTLALDLDFIPEDKKQKALEKLVFLIKREQYGITTGFVGTPYITKVLAENGYADIAYKMLLNKECPGWFYPITMGATTIWERWDSLLPDGTLNPDSMNSFNHYAYGAIAEWMYRNILGINMTKPAFKEFNIKPILTKNFTYAKGGTDTLYGRINSNWQYADEKLTMRFTVPENTTANVFFPLANEGDIVFDGKTCVVEDGVRISTGSGCYEFIYCNERVNAFFTTTRFSLESTLGDLMKCEETNAILMKYLGHLVSPEMLTNKEVLKAKLSDAMDYLEFADVIDWNGMNEEIKAID